MCGRFTISKTIDELTIYLDNTFSIQKINFDFKTPRYNISPGENIIAVLNDGSINRVGLINWGFIIPFKDEKTSFAINARSETLSTKQSFRDSYKYKRCVIIADSYYEWQNINGVKTPIRIVPKDSNIFSMAGLWTKTTKKDGTSLFTCVIITKEANSLISNIHNRMPVILDDESLNHWLNASNQDYELLNSIIKNSTDPDLYFYQVSTKVNSSRLDDESLIERIA